jgi:hypothetical protein
MREPHLLNYEFYKYWSDLFKTEKLPNEHYNVRRSPSSLGLVLNEGFHITGFEGIDESHLELFVHTPLELKGSSRSEEFVKRILDQWAKMDKQTRSLGSSIYSYNRLNITQSSQQFDGDSYEGYRLTVPLIRVPEGQKGGLSMNLFKFAKIGFISPMNQVVPREGSI